MIALILTWVGRIAAGLAAWLILAIPVAIVFCKAAQRRDCCPHVDLDDEPSLAEGGVWL